MSAIIVMKVAMSLKTMAVLMSMPFFITQVMRKPFLKFICHSASYFFFLFLLILVSQVQVLVQQCTTLEKSQ